MRKTVRPSPRKSQASPTRGSRSSKRVFLKPRGPVGSVDKIIPLPKSPVPGTKVPTRFVFVSNTVGVRGSNARRLAVGQAAETGLPGATNVNAVVQVG